MSELVEAARLLNDIQLAVVTETTFYDSPMLQVLPLSKIMGNGLKTYLEGDNENCVRKWRHFGGC